MQSLPASTKDKLWGKKKKSQIRSRKKGRFFRPDTACLPATFGTLPINWHIVG